MENLTSPWFLQGDKLVSALKPETVLQMVAVEDLGRIYAHGFTHAAEMRGVALDVSGDAVTLPAAAAALSAAFGRNITYQQIPMEAVRQNSADTAAMLEWFDAVGYNADIAALEKNYGPLTKLEIWASKLPR